MFMTISEQLLKPELWPLVTRLKGVPKGRECLDTDISNSLCASAWPGRISELINPGMVLI